MDSFLKRFSIKTTARCEFVDITSMVADAVTKSGVSDGVALVFCPHTTAAVTINENADPSVVRDIAMKCRKLIERDDPDYRHMEGNSDSHVKSSLTGASETIIIEKGRLLLGTWQAVYFAEFDGPRSRSVILKILRG